MLNSRLFLKILTFLIPAIWDEKGIVSASSIQAQLALHIHPELLTASLLEGNESRVLHVGTSRVTDRLVSDGEFTEVVASHLRLNLDGGEGLAVVDTNNGTNHLGHDDHVSEVGLNHSRLLVGAGLSLGLSELLDFLGAVPSDMAGLLALVALLGGKNCGFISRRKAVSSKVVLTVASVAFDRSTIRVNGWSRAATKSSAETATAPESTNESRYSALAGQMAGSTTFEALLTGTEGSTHRWTVRLNMAYTTTSVALLAIGRPGLRTVGRLVPRFPAIVTEATRSLAIFSNVAD